jgi:hypothetical protein
MNHKQLVQQMTDMKAELDKYQAELTRLRSQVSAYEDVEEAPAPASTTSRRKLLRRMAIAGIGGIGALGLAASVNPANTVLAETAADNAIEAVGGSNGYGLRAQGGLAPLFLVGGSTAGAPTAGTHAVGELYASNTGQLYYCVTAGTPGTWRQISGSSTSGSLHLLASPSRFVDTRSPGINDPGGAYTHNVSRNYQLTNLTGSGGATIPTGATGVVGNITVVGPTASGFGAIYTGTFNNTSNINFGANDTLANSFSSPLDSNGNLTVLIRLPGAPVGANANILLDIAGYYL